MSVVRIHLTIYAFQSYNHRISSRDILNGLNHRRLYSHWNLSYNAVLAIVMEGSEFLHNYFLYERKGVSNVSL